MSGKYGKRYTPKFKFQVVMEVIKSSKTVAQIARGYGVHPITIHKWKKEFEEKGPEIFGQKTTIHEYERKIRELEQLIGHKEVEIALLKNFFHRVPHFNDPLLCRLFTLEVFSLLLEKKLINKDLVQKILQWRHTGFNVHSKVRTETKESAERVGKYMTTKS